jgi:hypothetical protein
MCGHRPGLASLSRLVIPRRSTSTAFRIRDRSHGSVCPDRRFFALARTLFRAVKTRRLTIRVLGLRVAPMLGQTACEPLEFVVRFGREGESRARKSTGKGRQGPDQVPDAHLVWHGPVCAARFQHAVEGAAGKKSLKYVEW